MSDNHAAVHDSLLGSWPPPKKTGDCAAALRRLWSVFGRFGRKVSQITKSLTYSASQPTCIQQGTGSATEKWCH